MKELDIVYSDENSFQCDFDLTILIHGKHGWLRNETENCVIRAVPSLCSELGGDSEVSSQSSVIASGLRPSIFVDVLMAQLV